MAKTKWPKNKAHKQTTMAASPGAGIEAMWSYCSKKEERANGELSYGGWSGAFFVAINKGAPHWPPA